MRRRYELLRPSANRNPSCLDDLAVLELRRATAADAVEPASNGEERQRVARYAGRRAAPPASGASVVDLVRSVRQGVDLVSGHGGAQELDRARERRAAAPSVMRGVIDPNGAQHLLPPPAAD